jgi:hypothetical protein
VRTSTLDSRGQDKNLKPLAPRGNPLIGPFYVEGAMPGDTLVVHLDRVRTNRDTAYQSNLIRQHGVGKPDICAALPALKAAFATWKLDAAGRDRPALSIPAASSAATPSSLIPCWVASASRYRAMRSWAAVIWAVRRQFGFAASARGLPPLYSPSFQPGALLFMGDGHAQQGMANCRARAWRRRWMWNSTSMSFPARRLASRGWKMPTIR